MASELHLSGNELSVYAIIYGYTISEKKAFSGSISYIESFLGMSRRAVFYVLNKLVEKDLIVKTEKYVNGQKFCTYKTNLKYVPDKTGNAYGAKIARGGAKIARGGAKIAPNNIDDIKRDNIEKESISNSSSDSLNSEEFNSSTDSLSIQEKSPDFADSDFSDEEEDIPFDPVPVKEEKADRTDYESIQKKFNEICTSLPKCTLMSEKRKRLVKSVLARFTADKVFRAFELAEESDFLSGRSGAWSGCSFDWIFTSDNILKILEGNYANKPSKKGRRDNTSNTITDYSKFVKKVVLS